MSGYVRVHRKLLGHPAFRNDAEALAFAWMVMKAAWRPVRVRYKERSITLARGQVAVSQRDMARALDRDKAWIERLWKRLRSEAMIVVGVEAGVAVISICNYNEYQGDLESREAVDEALDEAGTRQGQGTEQEEEEIEEENKLLPRYAFAGRTIKLSKKDFETWRSTYHAIPDLRAELASIDAWLQSVPEQKKRWFHAVQKMLNKKHQELVQAKDKGKHWYLNEPLRV